MKTAKKALLLILCAIALVVATIMGTLAYLQDTTEVVKNTMTAGKVEIVSLNESKVSLYGVPDNSAERVIENAYKLIPGHTYTKDPVITIAGGSENAYVYISVVNEIAAIESPAADYVSIEDQIIENGWIELTGVNGVDNVYYREYTSQTDNLEYEIFEGFTLADDVTNDAIASYEGNTVEVMGYAVQIDGFDTPAAAWTAANFTAIS